MFKRIAVLGAGNGGKMMAAELSTAGWDLNLYEVPEFAERNLKTIRETGGIEVDISATPPDFKFPGGGKGGFNKISGKVTTNMGEALEGVDLIMLVVPAFARGRFIKEAAPYLKDGQTILIWPAYFGAFQCAKILKDLNVDKDIIICEAESLIYGCKSADATTEGGLNYIKLKDAKRKMAVSSLPTNRIDEVLDKLKKVYPAIQKAKNPIQTTMANVNLPLHPQSVLLNLYNVERKYYPYFEQIGGGRSQGYNVTPGMAKIMEAVDSEIRNIAKEFGADLCPLMETLKLFYNSPGENLYETILNTQCYQNQLAPTSLKHRFIMEDIAYGLVPIALIGEMVNKKVDNIKAMSTIACTATGINFWQEGLTREDMGLKGMNAQEIINFMKGM